MCNTFQKSNLMAFYYPTCCIWIEYYLLLAAEVWECGKLNNSEYSPEYKLYK